MEIGNDREAHGGRELYPCGMMRGVTSSLLDSLRPIVPFVAGELAVRDPLGGGVRTIENDGYAPSVLARGWRNSSRYFAAYDTDPSSGPEKHSASTAKLTRL